MTIADEQIIPIGCTLLVAIYVFFKNSSDNDKLRTKNKLLTDRLRAMGAIKYDFTLIIDKHENIGGGSMRVLCHLKTGSKLTRLSNYSSEPRWYIDEQLVSPNRFSEALEARYQELIRNVNLIIEDNIV